ncbi:MAG: oligosaccharide flippase family protein [Muribaculaceae bacterium]|nr:oligosaccharide flippase family protein [Muribaculaceae bacterium]
MKAMGIFGGVQVLGIVCSIVRTKLVALWIGSVGVGLFGLFNNALDMLNTATNLGIRSSSVRDISQAAEADDRSLMARIVAVVRRWSLWLGLGGALLTLALAQLLSRFTFGDDTHIWGFVALSSAVLFMALTNGEQAIMQGSQKLKRLASSTMWGTLCGLAISVPMFYWLRERSVVPSILVYAACNALAAWLLRNKEFPAVSMSARETAVMGRDFVRLGVYMTLGNFANILAAYIFNAWLNNVAGTSEVGFYQAGYTLVNKYTGLLFTALGMEYYPRLARVASHRTRMRVFVSQEVNVAMMVLAPIAVVFILLREQAVWLLYTSEFNVILSYVAWGMVGMVLRALSWCMAFVILARGDGMIYVVTEVLSAIATVILNIVCYRVWGLTGLGIAFLLSYVFYAAMIAVVYVWHYHLSMSTGSLVSTLWALGTTMGALVLMEHHLILWAAVLATGTVAVTLWQARVLWHR